MRTFRFLFAGLLLVAALSVFVVGMAAAQEPPVGNPPEPDDDLQHQIADMLMRSVSAQSAGAIEEDPSLWDLIKQQQPDLTVTLGGGPVGGVAELPDVQRAPVQTASQSSGPSLALVAALVVGLLALGAVGWYARRRLYLLLILGFAASAFLMIPAKQSEAGLAACILTARDVDISGPFNYLWYAGAACAGEDFAKGHIFVDWQYYDWNSEAWWDLACCIGSAGETNDEDIIAWGAKNVPSAPPPYTGLTCRRIEAFFWFEHSGRFQNFTVRSNGECY